MMVPCWVGYGLFGQAQSLLPIQKSGSGKWAVIAYFAIEHTIYPE